jgi:hypothetical protein
MIVAEGEVVRAIYWLSRELGQHGEQVWNDNYLVRGLAWIDFDYEGGWIILKTGERMKQ